MAQQPTQENSSQENVAQENIKRAKIIIIGSGSAGYTAAIYAARAGLQPIVIQGNEPGGQLTITTDVENFPGFASAVQGPWLMEQMEAQARNVGAEIIYDYINALEVKVAESAESPKSKEYHLTSDSGVVYIAKAIVIATGASAKWLGLDGEKKFQGYGVSGCATCDGFFFKDKKLFVIGGGNTAVEEALYLTNHAREVVLIHRRDKLRAEKIAQERLFKHPKISVLWNCELKEILGDEDPLNVTGAVLLNNKTGEEQKHQVDGIFVAIGHKPNTAIFEGKIDMDNEGYIKTHPDSTKTNLQGVFAAGDVQDKIYRQAVTAAGTGCMAALEAEKYLAELLEE